MDSDPIVIFIKLEGCPLCNVVTNVWENAKKEMSRILPNLKFSTIVISSKKKIDYVSAPLDLTRYMLWFPTILYIPAKTWKHAIDSHKNGVKVDILDGVNIFNGFLDQDKKPQHYKPIKYEYTVIQNYGKWIKSIIEENSTTKQQPTQTTQNNTQNQQNKGYIARKSEIKKTFRIIKNYKLI